MAVKQRAARNRTITLSPKQENEHLIRCVKPVGLSKRKRNTDIIIHGDCFDVLSNIPHNCVDLLIVDPPYNLDKTFGKNTFHKMKSANYMEFTRKWLTAVMPLLKETASIYVCCDWKTSLIIGQAINEFFIVQNRITWQREKGRGALSNWKNGMEDIWFATVSKNYTFNVDSVKQRRKVIAPYRVDGKPKDWVETADGNFRDTFPSNFWDDISIPYWSMPENTDHPTQKPEKLYAKLILAGSNPGDLVFDPFAGVGTSCVTAKKLGRHYIGIEVEAEYCALAMERLEMAESDKSIQGYANGVFLERNSLSAQKQSKSKTTDNLHEESAYV
jgi:site-specific DNA-methyltransferase (adenine-specific)